MGLTQQAPAHIQVDDPTPCRSHSYRYPEKVKETIASILKDLEERDIIEKSTAAWLSHIVQVSKPSGDKRMYLDYRKVNKQLTTDIHPLPYIFKRVSRTSGREPVLRNLNMKDAYYQVMLDEES